ncbi:AraC family transcriptional regulator [Pedobacter africanus]|uniref:YesN/AraC family two-component response regulator n=1 Tax=Pedobacter africanus TaxID=151894 RepID=A0ACC6KSM2_9SPHI|nr:helix-turn-helix transcriptional regulator [Pedobacter africanus]MDR6782353.1 YesN/AraC family two-component response regulator [Pedobacter africanus]
MKLAIKNMVCNRCILVVGQVLEKMNLIPDQIQVGEVELTTDLSDIQLSSLRLQLANEGFELLDDRKTMIVEKVKNIIIETIHGTDKVNISVNFSHLIQQKLLIEYNYISSFFSNTEGITIEQYIILQRIERAKELLVYDELSLGEISHKLGYKSLQHLSSQFKKITGLTPTQFKNIKENRRKPLDQL